MDRPSQKQKNGGRTHLLHLYLPSLLLIAMAGHQYLQSHQHDLSPWKGGGFGMYATIDAPNRRVFSAEGMTEKGERYHLSPNALSDQNLTSRLRSRPQHDLLLAYAQLLLNSEFVISNDDPIQKLRRMKDSNPQFKKHLSQTQHQSPVIRLKTMSEESQPEDIVKLKSIRLQQWRVRFDKDLNRVYSEKLGPPAIAGEWDE